MKGRNEEAETMIGSGLERWEDLYIEEKSDKKG